MEILELRSTMAELNNSIESFKSTLNYTEERISDLEERTFENMQSEDREKKTEKE